jgi:A/G-specific adenine glycosylase
MLRWYDENKRRLPWRANTDVPPVPYHVWLSEIMLQQTTVAAVIPYFEKFVDKWPSVEDLANAPRDEIMQNWAGLGYYARARNLHKCAKVVAQEYKGVFPDDIKTLKSLPGIGDYTSAAIRSIAFDKDATVVDGNVERVMARYYCVKDPLPGSKKQLKELAHILSDGRKDRAGDYAQALMDLGATVCTPKSPSCGLCPLQKKCEAHKAGLQAELPAKVKKKDSPKKHGYVYWIENKEGKVLLERRPDTVMLGHMVGLPTSSWIDIKSDIPVPNFVSDSEPLDQFVLHSFTHFDLKLFGFKAVVHNLPSDDFFWEDKDKLSNVGFPTLFKKFVNQMI